MTFDIPTFVLMGAFLQLLCGGLLIYAHYYYRDAPAPLWWGLSQTILAGGVFCSLTGGITDKDWITAVAFVFFIGAAATQWHGARLLTGAKPLLLWVVPGPLLIAAVNLIPAGEALPAIRGVTAMVLNLTYFGGALYVLVRPPAGKIAAYKPLAALFILNIIFVGLAPFGGLGSSAGGIPPLFSLVGLLNLEGVIFVIASTFFVVSALRERNEDDQRKAAGTDSLTGLANRRSFFERAGKFAARAEGTPFCVALFDLDHFKDINDRLGHAMGDEVLRVFARAATRLLRPNDILGRLGGEEFAAVLVGSGADTGYVIAERIRRAFEEAAAFLEGQPVHATLSAGVVASTTAPIDIDALLKDADAALYGAKQKGRNRVERHDGSMPEILSRVTRIA